jgi:microcin C transport system substrate-binding protein
VKGSRNLIGIQDPVVDDLIKTIIAAESREELVAATRALDRVLQWGFYVIPQWHMNAWRLAWWKKLDHPDHLSPLTPGIADTWWGVAE